MKKTGKSVKRTAKKTNSGTRNQSKGLLTQANRHDRLSLFLAGLVVLILVVVVSVNGMALGRRLRENHRRAIQLNEEIKTEKQRSADIEEYRRYTSTDA